MADRLLHVLMYGQPMARLVARGSSTRLTYEDAWLSRRDAFPLSLSLPLAAREHAARVVDPYLWNLLPDDHATLVDWARQFKVKLNAFALLEHVGEDVAGAAQFVRPERIEEVMGKDSGAIQWIDEAEIARRLRELRVNRSAWSQPGDVGYFSLPGAQPKLALLHEDGRWGIPSGRTPTTHILKPPIPDFDDYSHNEHFCLTLAAAAGLSAAKSTVQAFNDEHAWDRVGAIGGIESPRKRVRTMVDQLPERVEIIFKEFKSRGLAAKVISVLRTQILQQVKTTLAVLDAAS